MKDLKPLAKAALIGLSLSSTLGLNLSMPKPAEAYIFGTDDRTTPSYEWMTAPGQVRKAIGQLEIQKADGKYYTCTFTVVGRNIGLTNAHCLVDKQGQTATQIKAFAVRYGSRSFASANVDKFWLGRQNSPQKVGDYVNDWAVIRFTHNLGDQTGWFGNEAWSYNVNNSGKTVVGLPSDLIGYHGDWHGGNFPGAHFFCNLDTVKSGLVLHSCDSAPGASGTGIHSPNNNGRLRALNAGYVKFSGNLFYPNRRTEYNMAVPLERFMPAVDTLRRTGAASWTRVPIR